MRALAGVMGALLAVGCNTFVTSKATLRYHGDAAARRSERGQSASVKATIVRGDPEHLYVRFGPTGADVRVRRTDVTVDHPGYSVGGLVLTGIGVAGLVAAAVIASQDTGSDDAGCDVCGLGDALEGTLELSAAIGVTLVALPWGVYTLSANAKQRRRSERAAARPTSSTALHTPQLAPLIVEIDGTEFRGVQLITRW